MDPSRQSDPMDPVDPVGPVDPVDLRALMGGSPDLRISRFPQCVLINERHLPEWPDKSFYVQSFVLKI